MSSVCKTCVFGGQARYRRINMQAQIWIKLAIRDSAIIHISGAVTAKGMWKQLTTVKELKGRLGVLAIQQAMYRVTAEEGFDMVSHILKLRQNSISWKISFLMKIS